MMFTEHPWMSMKPFLKKKSAGVAKGTPTRTWVELDHRLDVIMATRGSHFEVD